MKATNLIFAIIFFTVTCFLPWGGQRGASQSIGINTTGISPDNSAALDVSSNNSGLLIPRMTSAQRNAIISPADGLLIYNTDCNGIELYDGGDWIPVFNSASLLPVPGTITGNNSPYLFQTGVSYSIGSVAGATSYSWTLPSGTSITSGQGTNSITADFGCNSGQVCVTAGSSCANSISSCSNVTIIPCIQSNSWTYDQNFDGLGTASLIGQDGWFQPTGSGTADVITTDSPYEGTKHIKMIDLAHNGSFTVQRSLPASITSGTIFFSVRRNTNSAGYFILYLLNNNSLSDIDIEFYSNGQVRYYANGFPDWAQIDALTYSANTYYRVAVAFEMGTGGWMGLAQRNWKISIDGGCTWSSPLGMERASGSSMISMQLQTYSITDTDINYVDFISPCEQCTIPSVPTALAATGIQQTQFTANWNSVAGAITYYLDVATDAGFTSFVPGYNNLNVGNLTTYNVTGLTCNSTYYYRIRAGNACGSSGNSNTTTITTTTCNVIAFDALSTGSNNPAIGPLNISHTCSGSNRMLLVGVFSQSGDIVTGVTYNGISCTFLEKLNANGDWMYVYYLINPPSGTNTCSISYPGNSYVQARVVSYTSTDQSSQPDAYISGTKSPATTSFSNSITTVADNCWVTIWLRNQSGGITVGNNIVNREGFGSLMWGDSNGPKTPAGSLTQEATGPSSIWGYIQVSIKP